MKRLTSIGGLSIVIPAFNEEGSIGGLLEEIAVALWQKVLYEIIVVDDGSTDDTLNVLTAIQRRGLPLRVLQHKRSAGQSAAIHAGVSAAAFELVCTLDGDGQNPPSDLHCVLEPFLKNESAAIGLVAGQRANRQDSFSRRMASTVANTIRRHLLRDGTRDTGCGLKAFRRDAYLRLPYFDHMHRYLPALFARDGWKVELVQVGHRPRVSGTSKYSNLQRALVGIVDLCGVIWLIRRRRKEIAYPLEIKP